MKVKAFDMGHEKDLEKVINEFLSSLKGEVIDIKFSTCCMRDENNEQIYCFSALIIYQD